MNNNENVKLNWESENLNKNNDKFGTNELRGSVPRPTSTRKKTPDPSYSQLQMVTNNQAQQWALHTGLNHNLIQYSTLENAIKVRRKPHKSQCVLHTNSLRIKLTSKTKIVLLYSEL